MENGYKKTKEIKLQPEGTRNTGEGRHLQIKQLNVLVTTLNKKLEELRKRLKLNMFENILKFVRHEGATPSDRNCHLELRHAV